VRILRAAIPVGSPWWVTAIRAPWRLPLLGALVSCLDRPSRAGCSAMNRALDYGRSGRRDRLRPSGGSMARLCRLAWPRRRPTPPRSRHGGSPGRARGAARDSTATSTTATRSTWVRNYILRQPRFVRGRWPAGAPDGPRRPVLTIGDALAAGSVRGSPGSHRGL
jgi:hypothetical protein